MSCKDPPLDEVVALNVANEILNDPVNSAVELSQVYLNLKDKFRRVLNLLQGEGANMPTFSNPC